MRLFLLAVLLCCAALSGAQDPKRVAAIWAAVDERFSTQADAWFEDGEFPMTIQLLRMQADLNPNDYDIATNLGWMLENVEDYETAASVYEGYRRANPKDPDATLPLAEYWFRKKQYAKVIALLPKISDSAHPNNFRILAHSFERTGKLAESQALWKRYLALHPKDLTAVQNLKRVDGKIKAAGNR